MKKLMLLAVLMTSCTTGDDEAMETLRKHGFRNIQTQGVAIFSCGENHPMGRKFTATNVNGETVDGVVCCAMFTGCSVKF